MDEIVERTGRTDSAAVIASWDRIERASSHMEHGFVSTGLRGGHHHEVLNRDRALVLAQSRGERTPSYGGIRADSATFELGMAYLTRVRPAFLFLGLGETDEHAHADHYVAYFRALARADAYLGVLRAELEKLRELGHPTLLLVTTDHGRAKHFRDHGGEFPESSESFLLSEGAESLLLEQQPRLLGDIRPLIESMLAHHLDSNARE